MLIAKGDGLSHFKEVDVNSMMKTLFVVTIICLSWTSSACFADTVTYYYTNEQGTILAVTDATGVISSTDEYRPYGVNALGSPHSGLGYTGHIEDPDAQLVYMQARYYDAALGRFLSPDPVTPTSGGVFRVNRYAYANNNPAVNIDPDGRNTNDDGRNTDPCSRAANVCISDYQSGDGAPARSPQPSSYDKDGVPEDAYLFWSGDGTYQFYGPASEQDFNAIDVTARKDADNSGEIASLVSVRKAISQGGKFDIQRHNGKFEISYQAGANFNVGFYMQRAGYSLPLTVFLGTTYSVLRSSNAAKQEDQVWWGRGWKSAQSNQYPISMRNHPAIEDVQDASR